jgi:hypothetical protein
VLFTAMSQAADPKKAADIKAKLEGLQSKELVTTREFAFQADHSPLRDLFVFRIDKDGVRFEKTLPARSP